MFTQAAKLSSVYFQVIFDCEKCLVTIWAWQGTASPESHTGHALSQTLEICLAQTEQQCQRQGEISEAYQKLCWSMERSSAFLLRTEYPH